jgi:hypothetical protein
MKASLTPPWASLLSTIGNLDKKYSSADYNIHAPKDTYMSAAPDKEILHV